MKTIKHFWVIVEERKKLCNYITMMEITYALCSKPLIRLKKGYINYICVIFERISPFWKEYLYVALHNCKGYMRTNNLYI